MKTVYIIALIISLISLAESFIRPDKNYAIFSINMNLWLYRGFWLVIFLGTAYDLYKNSRDKKIS